MIEVLKKLQRSRLDFLYKMYELSKGSTEVLNCAQVASQIGFKDGEEEQIVEIVLYLGEERLIQIEKMQQRFPEFVSLTYAGLREIEEAISHPDRQTVHFFPINILYVNHKTDFTIQQSTNKNTQTFNMNPKGLQ